MMPGALKTILDFVEERIDAKQFEAALYADAPSFEQVLNHDPDLPSHHYASPSVYLYIIRQDFSDPGDILSVHGALSQYLERNGVACHPAKTYGDFYDLLLQAQPDWLDVDAKYLANVVKQSDGLTGEELKQWLHAELLKRFRYLVSPPDWIQNPAWPINDNGPLFFLGQMDVLRYFHDVAAAYVFYDRENGQCETIIQVS